MTKPATTCSLALTYWVLAAVSGSAADEINFNRDIRPILSRKCFQCHGPDENEREAELRLDISDGDDGAYRSIDETQAIKPGDPDASAVFHRITTEDEFELMPPPEAEKGALSEEEIELIRQWIAQGAEYETFWSFVPPSLPATPSTKNQSWSSRDIDLHVMARLEEEGLKPNPKADKRTLIRRVTLDLTGLPPTLDEIEAFLSDESDDAYANLVERLLAKPQYGEHMAKYWLDLVRFADTNGLHHDHYREMTPYRDWVIRSFNQNLSFDKFITYQLAGDLYESPTIDQQIASGFNRLHLIIDRGTALPEESFMRNVVDRVTSVGTAFLGLTVQCAVCHDHKYDPITQRDFYQLYAFFNNFDGGPETGGRRGSDFRRGLQPPYINLPTPDQESALKDVEAEIVAAKALVKKLKAAVPPAAEKQAKNDKGADDNTKEQLDEEQAKQAELARKEAQQAVKQAEEALKKIEADKLDLEMTIPATLVMKERSEIRPAHIMIRGAYDQPGEPVQRDTPAFLPPLQSEGELKTRMDLARWLVAESNPLTARVTVNRLWQQLFGVGLVKTSEDFGAQGQWPSHPELLDYLAVQFVQSGWDVKEAMRQIVLSETYQQSSRGSAEQFATDPENRKLARGPRFRLDAEMIRDQILAVSGLLNREMYGRSVKPPQPPNLWTAVAMPSSYPRVFEPDTGDRIYRRSVYTFWKRGLPPPQMTIFDAPTREACIARRERTNTPLQALLLMNEQHYFEAAMHCAENLLESPDLDTDRRITRAYEQITSHLPSESEMETLRQGIQSFRELYSSDPQLAQQMTASHTSDRAQEPEAEVELAAWTMLVHSLLNLDVTKTRQ